MSSRYKQYNDIQLSELVVQNDTHAFEEFYNRHWLKLYLFAKKRLDTKEEAEDVVQEVFMKLFQKLPSVHAKQSLVPYLYESLRSTMIDLFRRGKRKEEVISSFREYYEKGVYDTDNQVNYNELERLIEEEISSLPPQMRKIYEMSKKRFMSNVEIAEELNITEESVKKQLYRGIHKLRNRLGRKFWLNIIILLVWLNRSL
ncbi:RNA polymerase sigma factor [Chitinophaga filiformis]|uniref:RNA polymerase sigma-70 factor, ECF subfamily n=1 Tax=Chitinophaga filiformis TaxID=104663 RepID=A0A1G7MGI8_CHIFI|nr:RNA polymerase sigma-70 factor [Chitinophaga filiformis]SDF60279.1 RNA polymerase sigma-70 factor, ECF subfamily [Chitinophaga filiformis]